MPSVLSTLLGDVHDVNCYPTLHPWHESCFIGALQYARAPALSAPRFYIPFYLASLVLRGKGIKHVPQALAYALRSSSLVVCQAFLLLYGCCLFRKLLGGMTPLSFFIPTTCVTFLGYYLEPKQRRQVLYIYCTQTALDCLYKMLRWRGLVSDISHEEVYIFSAASAAVFYLYRKHSESMNQSLLGSLLKFLLMEPAAGSEDTEERRIAQYRQWPSFIPSVQMQEWLQQHMAGLLPRARPQQAVVLALADGVVVAARAFTLAYGLAALKNVLSRVTRLLRQPGQILRALFSKDAVQFGLFVSGFAGITKVLSAVLSLACGKQWDGLTAAIAGGVGGLSMAAYPSSTLALGLACKVSEMFVGRFQDAGQLPRIPQGDAVLYALSMGIIGHVVIAEPQNISPAFYKTMLMLTNGMLGRVDHRTLEPVVTGKGFCRRRHVL